MRRVYALLLCAACGAHAGDGLPEALRGLPPRQDPPLDLNDEDDLGRGRAAYDAMLIGDAQRPVKRRELWAAYRQRIERVLPDSRDQAQNWFERAISMWDASELADDKKPPADVDLLAPTSEALYRQFSSSGSDVEAATALAVLIAARPERRAEYEKTWTDLESYVDGLAMAEAGPGAQGSRPIIVLENVTGSFPSRWAIDRLLSLYAQRQDRLQKYVANKGTAKQLMNGALSDRGVSRPVWNLIRAYARGGRLPEAPEATKKLAGQFLDQPELRKALDSALAGQNGQEWVAVALAYVPSERMPEGDMGTALAICAYAAEKLPKDPQVRKCAAEIARLTDRVPLALRWIEEARKLAPDELDSTEVAARLYLARMGDLLQAERLDAARGRMTELEAFFKDVEPRFKDKKMTITLGDACLVYGRGLFNQGDVANAQVYLRRAESLGRPQAAEELATIDMKTGRYPEAAAGYENASALPRPTPIETTFEGARLKRLAGEAWKQAGNEAKAKALWKEAHEQWTDVMSAQLNPRARAEAYIELGRVRYDVGQGREAAASMAAAVDAAPNETGVYSDVISFLATRGFYEDAIDAYHRALGRDEVTDYMKVYSSIWMLDLAAIRGLGPDTLAQKYLDEASKGTRWFHQLARFKIGKASYGETVKAADTRGKRAEAYFYEGMNRYAKGDKREAEKLMRQVIATQMLGFFEYDMATWYLRNGPPRK